MLLIDAMIKIHACQRNKQFMKDLEHNDFPVRKKKEKEKIYTSVQKNWAKLLKKNQKIARGFLHEFGMENY